MDRTEAARPTPTLLIALAWTVVTIPLAWGVYRSVVQSLPLFRMSAPRQDGVRSTPHAEKTLR